jgi:hypothetical protein
MSQFHLLNTALKVATVTTKACQSRCDDDLLPNNQTTTPVEKQTLSEKTLTTCVCVLMNDDDRFNG